MGSLVPELREQLHLDEVYEEAMKKWSRREAFRLQIMLNPERNPQWALYKAIEDGTLEDMQRAFDAGACPDRLQNNQPCRGAALAHQIEQEVWCIDKARLLISNGCSVQSEGYLSLLEGLADKAQFWDEEDDEACIDADAVKLGAFLYQKGAPLPGDTDDEDLAEFMSMVQEEILEQQSMQAASVAHARRL